MSYKQMYLELFKSMTDAIEVLQKGLIAAEEIYMICGDEGETDETDDDEGATD